MMRRCICLNAFHRSARPNPTCAPSRAGCMRSYSRCCAPGRRACPLCRLLGGPFPPGSAPPSEEAAGDAAGNSTARHTTASASLTAAPSPARHPSCSRQASGLKSGRRLRPGGVSADRGCKQRTGGVSSGQGQKCDIFSILDIQRDLDEAIPTVALRQKTLHGIDFSLKKRD